MFSRKLSASFLAIVLTFTLTAAVFTGGCTKKPATTVTSPPAISLADQIIYDAKTYGPVVAAAIEEGIKQEIQMASSGAITGPLEPTIRRWLQDGLKVVNAFNDRAATWDHFDASKKADIQKFLTDALAFVQKIYDEGVLRITNPQSQSIASGILSGAKVTLILWQSKLAQAPQ